jgi:two-component system OmpR family response regulator
MNTTHFIKSNGKGTLQRGAQIRNVITVPEKSKFRSKGKKTILFIVDDDPLYLKGLELSISANYDDITIFTFQTGEACLQQMKLKPEIVILDYYLDSEISYAWNGLNILKQIKKTNPKSRVVMLSSQDSLQVASECLENGAYDYVSKTQSAFVRINHILGNILEYDEVQGHDRTWQFVALLLTFIILILILLNH